MQILNAVSFFVPIQSLQRLAGLAVVILLLTGCADTDRDLYAEGETGVTDFMNTVSGKAVWLGGCNTFTQERWDGARWINQGGDITCFWEGFAQAVPSEETRSTSFTARDPGTWRLSYEVGFNCQEDEPLAGEYCGWMSRVVTDEFTVLAADDDEGFCTATGGDWNAGYCGDLFCGQPNLCLALIPGCNCGPNANFVAGEGCVEDPACGGDVTDAQLLCESTGGEWDPLSCGHYSCGAEPACRAVIPGCDCGPFSVFDEEAGCLAVPCGAPS